MSLKSKEIIIEKGRDKGTKFIITEMPVAKADRWAMRALLSMHGAGISVPDPSEGMLGIARIAIDAIQSMKTDTAIDLLDELLDCVQIVPEGGKPRPLELSFNDVKDFSTLWRLRKEALSLHIDFLQDALIPTLG